MVTKKIATPTEQTQPNTTTSPIWGNELQNTQKQIKEVLDTPSTLDTIEILMVNEWYANLLKNELKKAPLAPVHNASIIDMCYQMKATDSLLDFAWLDLALTKILADPTKKIVLTCPLGSDSFLSHKDISPTQKDKFIFLLSHHNVRFLQTPCTRDQLSTLFTQIDDHQPPINSEVSFQHIIEQNISTFLHDDRLWTKLWNGLHLTHEAELSYLIHLPEEKKNEQWIAFENKLIALLQIQHPSFKLLPRKQNLQRIVDMFKYSRTKGLPEGTRFEGVFVDRDGTLYDNKKLIFNQHIIDMIKEYEKQWKKITLWTWWNLEIKQKLLDEAWLDYKIQNKTDYKWWTVEIAIDNDSQEFLLANAKIISEHHIKV